MQATAHHHVGGTHAGEANSGERPTFKRDFNLHRSSTEAALIHNGTDNSYGIT